METSFAYIKSDIICELLTQMAHMVNKNIEIKNLENEDLESVNELYQFLKLIEKIIYRFFYNHTDNSLKFLDFSNQNDYQNVLSCFKSLKILKSTKKVGLRQDLMDILFPILEDSDNQYNNYNNQYLISKLMSLLMQTFCRKNSFKVLQIIKVKLSNIESQSYPYVLKKIIRNYHKFVKLNFQNNKYEFPFEKEFQEIDHQIHEKIQHQKSMLKYSSNESEVELAFFKCKVQLEFEQFRREPYHFVLKNLMELSQERTKEYFQSYSFSIKLGYLTRFLERNFFVFAEELSRKKASPELCKNLASTAWECVISGPSIINPQIQHWYSQIYKTLYYYWSPFYCSESEDASMRSFCLDTTWLSSELEYLRECSRKIKERYMLQIQNRQRSTFSTVNQDTYQDISKYIHKNPNYATEKDISFYILRKIMQLPQIREIEEQMTGSDKVQNCSSNQIYIKVQKKLESVYILQQQQLHQVKSKIKKEFTSMEKIESEIVEVIKIFHEKNKLNLALQDQYIQLTKNYFVNGKKALEKYQRQSGEDAPRKVIITNSGTFHPKATNVSTNISLKMPDLAKNSSNRVVLNLQDLMKSSE